MARAAELEALLGPQMTLEEWTELPDDVPGEFVDGRLVEEETPNVVHEVIVMWLGHVFPRCRRRRDLAVVRRRSIQVA